MQSIWGGYAEVEFTDGSRGAYEVAQKYYRDFDQLRVESPEKFNRICHSVLGQKATWGAEERHILAAVGLQFALASDGKYAQNSPEEEVRQFIRLAVKPTIVSRMFGILCGDIPDYDLQSPFKHPVHGAPDQVAPKHQQEVAFEWMGNDIKDCPGKYLISQSAQRVAAARAPQPSSIL